jgi:RsiW-degrading membrane proteinase PrsW (M82 family)
MLVGPVVEETVKAVALAVVVGAWVERVDTVRDAVVYGALVGVGFATAENAEYFTLAAVRAGIAGLARAVWQRAVLGVAAHPVFTALVATAVPTWRRGSRRTAIATTLTALAAAVAQHTVWNAVAAPFIETRLCDAPTPAAPCRPVPPLGDLLVTAPLTVIVLTAPAIVFLARRTRPRAAAPRPS